MRPAVAPRPSVDLTSAVRSTYRVAFAVWAIFGALCFASAFWDVRTHGHSPLKIFAYELFVWWGWAIATPMVAWLGRRAPLLPLTLRAAALHAAVAIAMGLLHHAWWMTLVVWMRPFDGMGPQALGPALVDNVREKLFLEIVVYFAVLGVTYAVDYRRRLRDREIRTAQLEASLVRARLDALELQLQPHFLFNTLHAIGGLVRQQRGPEAIEMIAGLSDLLRYSLDCAGKHRVALDRELEILERYLEIQTLRFSDRLRVTIDVPGELRGALVPALLLQPLVENAVRHGVERATEASTIRVTAWRDGDRMTIEIFNSGALGSQAEGIGITNTRSRLEQLYGGDHALVVTSAPGGVVARVVIPLEVPA